MADFDDEVDFDFDQAWAERKATNPKIRLMGEVYELPKVIPAKLILYITKMTKGKKAKDDVDDPAVFLEMIKLIFGEDNSKKILDSGVGIDQLPEVIERVQRIYMDRAEKAMAESRKGKSGN